MGIRSSDPRPQPPVSPDPLSLTELGLGGNAPAAPSPGAKPRSDTDMEFDIRLESELVLLLSQLDYARGLLVEAGIRRSPSQSLPILVEILEAVMAFAQRHLETGVPGDLPVRAKDLADLARHLANNASAGGVRSLLGWFRKPALSAAESHQLFRQIQVEAPEVVSQFFTLFTTAFRASSFAQQWNQTSSQFLTDLAAVVGQLEG